MSPMGYRERWRETPIQETNGRLLLHGGKSAALSRIALAVYPNPDAGVRQPTSSPPSLDAIAALRSDPRLAVREDTIRCLICGGVFRQLTNTHLRVHGTVPADYKRRFGYNRGRPLMCRQLLKLYSERAVKSRLAERIRRRRILIEPELRRLGGSRQITLEELLTRQDSRRRGERADRGQRPRVLTG
jgi:ROS/MUCR transcriptional regulator protein